MKKKITLPAPASTYRPPLSLEGNVALVEKISDIACDILSEMSEVQLAEFEAGVMEHLISIEGGADGVLTRDMYLEDVVRNIPAIRGIGVEVGSVDLIGSDEAWVDQPDDLLIDVDLGCYLVDEHVPSLDDWRGLVDFEIRVHAGRKLGIVVIRVMAEPKEFVAVRSRWFLLLGVTAEVIR